MSPENPFKNMNTEVSEVVPRKIEIPENELEFSFAASGGPGGQGVNTSNSKAVLHWNIGASTILSEDEKERIRAYFGKRVNADDEVVMSCSTQRSQRQNREQVTEELHTLVAKALIVAKERKPTTPTKGSERRRLDEKTKQGRKKEERGRRLDE